MKIRKWKTLAFVLALVLAVSLSSAQTNIVKTQALGQTAQAQLVGGGRCARAWGMEIALIIGTLTPCDVLCAAGAWYNLAAIGAFC